VQWKRLFDHLALLNEGDPAHVLTSAFSVGDALGGMSDERHLRRLYRSPAGRELIDRRASLVDALADHTALEALPPDSLGRHFLAFSQRHGLDSRKLIESQHAMSRDYSRLDPVRQWLSDRLTVMHDLWHVLAGYDATTAGESALMCFSLPQRVNDRALPIFVTMSVSTRKIRLRNALEAIQRGRRALYLVEQPLEQQLPLPLETVRRQLRITPPRVAHPRTVTEGMLIPDVTTHRAH
jgi:ubiquinone biosynthesis protein COQ4